MAYIGNEPLSVAFLVDTFSGNGSTVAFTMSVAPANTSSILVAITGVVQDPSTYSVSGTTLTFSAAPPSGTSNISVRYLGIPASGVTTTAYRTVTDSTATAGQTTFTIPSYTVGYVDVFRNGVRLAAADFTATTGTTIVLASAASAGDTITTVSFYVSSVLNAIPATAGSINQAYLAGNVGATGPAFNVYKSVNQTISQNTWTKVTLDTEIFDTNSNFASSTFTPTVAGYYQPTGVVYFNGTAARQYVFVVGVYKNGVVYSRSVVSIALGTGADFCVPVSSALVQMNGTTDTLELYAYSYDYTSGASVILIGGVGYTTFGAYLARAA